MKFQSSIVKYNSNLILTNKFLVLIISLWKLTIPRTSTVKTPYQSIQIKPPKKIILYLKIHTWPWSRFEWSSEEPFELTLEPETEADPNPTPAWPWSFEETDGLGSG